MVGSKQAKARGADFELRVRKDMTENGWIVDKFGNNVEFEEPKLEGAAKTFQKMSGEFGKLYLNGKLIIAKNKWAGPNRPMMMGAGFPDFVCFKWHGLTWRDTTMKHEMNMMAYEVIGVECKCNGWLSQLEREKCRWLLDNNVFSKILIAERTKPKNRIVIVYHDFEEKYGIRSKQR